MSEWTISYKRKNSNDEFFLTEYSDSTDKKISFSLTGEPFKFYNESDFESALDNIIDYMASNFKSPENIMIYTLEMLL